MKLIKSGFDNLSFFVHVLVSLILYGMNVGMMGCVWGGGCRGGGEGYIELSIINGSNNIHSYKAAASK